MNLEATVNQLIKRVAALEQDNKRLRGKQETWLKVTDLLRNTNGWDKERLRRARENGEVKFEDRKDTGRWYLLESLSPIHRKEKSLLQTG